MKIIDIIKHGLELLDMNEELKILATANQENENEVLKNEEIKKMFNLFKLSMQELCSNYLPMVTEAEIETSNKSYPASNLLNFIRVQGVYKNEKPIKFKFINRKLTFVEDGKYQVKYLTYPELKSIFEDLDFLSNLSPEVLVLGVVSYYCLSKGLFDDFKIYHDNYVEKAESIKALKFFNMPQRRWQ